MKVESVSSCPQCGASQAAQESALLFCSQCRFPLKLLAHKYRLTGVIAEGGFGTVYRAEHIHLQEHQERAVKILKPEVMRARGMEARFFREVRVTASLSQHNEHIIRIYDDFGQDEHLGYYYVMEFLHGRPLAEALHREGMSLKAMLTIAIQLCQAIEAAHRASVVHRDLKPENIFLTMRPEHSTFVKVLDFGIAKPLAGTAHGNLTQGVLGTPNYMAPEQCMGAEVGPAVDIYAVGVIFYEMLAGHAPFEHLGGSESGFLQILNAHLTTPPPSLGELRPDLPRPLVSLVHQMLDKDPTHRPASMEGIAQTLRLLYSGEEMSSTASGGLPFLETDGLPSAELSAARASSLSPSLIDDQGTLSLGEKAAIGTKRSHVAQIHTPDFAIQAPAMRIPTGSLVPARGRWIVPVLLGLVLVLGGALGAVVWMGGPLHLAKKGGSSHGGMSDAPVKGEVVPKVVAKRAAPRKDEPAPQAPSPRQDRTPSAVALSAKPTDRPSLVAGMAVPATSRRDMVPTPQRKHSTRKRKLRTSRGTFRSSKRALLPKSSPPLRRRFRVARQKSKRNTGRQRRVRVAALVRMPVPEREIRLCESMGRRRRWREAYACLRALEEAHPRASRLALAEAVLLFRQHRCSSTYREEGAETGCKEAAALFRRYLAVGGERWRIRLAERRLRTLERIAGYIERREMRKKRRLRIRERPRFRAVVPRSHAASAPPTLSGYTPPELPAEETPKVRAFVEESQRVKALLDSGANSSKKSRAARALWSTFRGLQERVHAFHLRAAASGLAASAYFLAQPTRKHFLSLQMEPSDMYGAQLRSITSAFSRLQRSYRPLAHSLDARGSYCNIFLSAEAYDHMGRQVVAYARAVEQYRHLPTHRHLRTSSVLKVARSFLSSAKTLYQTAFRSLLGRSDVICRKDLMRRRAALRHFLDDPKNSELR